jgi:hypothetical protein
MTGDGVGTSLPELGKAIDVPRVQTGELASVNDSVRALALAPAITHCRAGVSVMKRSPVLSSITAAIATMRAGWGCSAEMPCTLLVRSDLQETENPSVRDALRARGRRLATRVAELTPLDLGGIDVRICGTGQSTEHVDDARLDATIEVWGRLLPGVPLIPNCV